MVVEFIHIIIIKLTIKTLENIKDSFEKVSIKFLTYSYKLSKGIGIMINVIDINRGLVILILYLQNQIIVRSYQIWIL